MRIPVLTYHSINIHGNDYANNDHAALAEDLRLITGLGMRVLPLHRIVDLWLSGDPSLDSPGVVALTCDDGPDFDYHDLEHPSHGAQRSMLNILRDFQRLDPRAQPDLHLTAFVIVGPEARKALDLTCMVGRDWWTDDWWAQALATGLLGIGNHSWDHNHDTLDQERPFVIPRGTFRAVREEAAADYEILQADAYLCGLAPNPSASLFAYPYGESNDYLAGQYFPALARQSTGDAVPGSARGRFAAAFTTEPVYWSRESDRWRLPRFTCGLDWKSPQQLAAILEGRVRN
jgi:peptidoglycan/xylan/chitin deacetylase (PgdA/CDA1 family)